MNKNKKLLLGFGTLTTMGVPFATAISCGNNVKKDDEIKNIDDLLNAGPNSTATKIADGAFSGEILGAEFHFPSSITTIGKEAFLNAQLPYNFVIPKTITEISDSAFHGATAHSKLMINDWNTYSGLIKGQYYGYGDLIGPDLKIPNTITKIEDVFFKNALLPYKLTIPDSVASIGEGSFAYSGLSSSFEIPNSITEIGDFAFLGASLPMNFKVPKSVKKIGEHTFYNIKLPKGYETDDYYTYISLKLGGYKDYAMIKTDDLEIERINPAVVTSDRPSIQGPIKPTPNPVEPIVPVDQINPVTVEPINPTVPVVPVDPTVPVDPVDPTEPGPIKPVEPIAPEKIDTIGSKMQIKDNPNIIRDEGVKINPFLYYDNADEIKLIQSEPLLEDALTTSFSYPAKSWLRKVDELNAKLPKNETEIRSEDASSYDVPANIERIIRIMDYDTFNYLFPVRRDLYTYRGFLEAAVKYPTFCGEKNNQDPLIANMSLDEVAKLELSSMFAHFARETGANAQAGPVTNHIKNGGDKQGTISRQDVEFPTESWRQSLYLREEIGYENQTVSKYMQRRGWSEHTFPRGGLNGYEVSYHGRGPMQLSWNYNYGALSRAMFNDDTLLANPDLVKLDGKVAFGSSFWSYMQPSSPNPSIHDTVVGHWIPSANDIAAGRNRGFGVQTVIMNGDIEAGKGTPTKGARDRQNYFESISTYFGVDFWWRDNKLQNGCENSKVFNSTSSSAFNSYYNVNRDGQIELIEWEENGASPFIPGDYQLFKENQDGKIFFKPSGARPEPPVTVDPIVNIQNAKVWEPGSYAIGEIVKYNGDYWKSIFRVGPEIKPGTPDSKDEKNTAWGLYFEDSWLTGYETMDYLGGKIGSGSNTKDDNHITPKEGIMWSSGGQIYLEGDIVTYKGFKWRAWSSTNVKPGTPNINNDKNTSWWIFVDGHFKSGYETITYLENNPL